MRGWTALLLLVTAATASLPTAAAHDCNGTGCGPCTRGEHHNHNDWAHGQCSTGPRFSAENSYRDGQRAEVPFPDLALSFLAVGLAVAGVLWLRKLL